MSEENSEIEIQIQKQLDAADARRKIAVENCREMEHQYQILFRAKDAAYEEWAALYGYLKLLKSKRAAGTKP